VKKIGDKTKWGVISAVGWLGEYPLGERYYWMVGKHGTVSMMPADVVEVSQPKQPQSKPKSKF